jgi:hypothetical protein
MSRSIEPTVVDEAYMERFADDVLAYKAWEGADLAQEILFDGESDADSLSDAKCEVAHAAMALRVLVRRMTGMEPDELRKAIIERRLEHVMRLDDDAPVTAQPPAWETLQ